jgi:hypothetical protein
MLERVAGVDRSVLGSDRDGVVPVGLGLEMPVNNLIRDTILIAISLVSWWTTPRDLRGVRT